MKHKPLVRLWSSEFYKVDFLGIPKTGSTTIRSILELDPAIWRLASWGNKYPVFTVVRDPFERFVSGYQEARRRGTFTGTVSELLERIKGGDFVDEHLLPQSYYLNEAKKHIEIDKYFVCGMSLVYYLNDWLDTDFQDVRHNATNDLLRVQTRQLASNLIDDISYLYKEDFDLMPQIYG